jgi:hypothetical protein
MIEKSLWIRNIFDPISEIADSQYQYRAWILNEVHDYCSFEDTICKLYDDARFDSFVTKGVIDMEFPPELISKLKKFEDMLDQYVDDNSTWDEEAKVINDPEWHKVSQVAKELVSDFQCLHLV